MEDRLYLQQSPSVENWRSRGERQVLTIGLIAAIIGAIVVLMLPGAPTPTLAGLRWVPRPVQGPLRTQLLTYGRIDPCQHAAGCGVTLTGAALLSRSDRTLRLETVAEYRYSLKGPPPNGAPVGRAAVPESYTVLVTRKPHGGWRLTSVLLIPQPQAHEG